LKKRRVLSAIRGTRGKSRMSDFKQDVVAGPGFFFDCWKRKREEERRREEHGRTRRRIEKAQPRGPRPQREGEHPAAKKGGRASVSEGGKADFKKSRPRGEQRASSSWEKSKELKYFGA